MIKNILKRIGSFAGALFNKKTSVSATFALVNELLRVLLWFFVTFNLNSALVYAASE